MKNNTSSTPNHANDDEPKKPSEKKPQHWNWQTLFQIIRNVGSVLSVITTFLNILHELGLL